MDYRKIIRNKETRFKILHYLRLIPDSWMVKFQYKIKMGRKLDLKNLRDIPKSCSGIKSIIMIHY